MTFTVNALSPALGAEIEGLDLARPLAADVFRDLHQAWLAHDGLLVIRDQRLTPDQQIAFSRHFGPLFGEAEQFQKTVHKYLLPGQPAIYRVSNKTSDGEPKGRAKAGNYWHSDGLVPGAAGHGVPALWDRGPAEGRRHHVRRHVPGL